MLRLNLTMVRTPASKDIELLVFRHEAKANTVLDRVREAFAGQWAELLFPNLSAEQEASCARRSPKRRSHGELDVPHTCCPVAELGLRFTYKG